MADWYDNVLVVSGKQEEVRRFVEENQGSDAYLSSEPYLLDFSYVRPEPNDKQGDPDWALQNWGTSEQPRFKYHTEIDFRTVSQDLERATYRFITAWGTCQEWLAQASERYPELGFCLTFYEYGQNYGGIIVYSNGQIISEEQGLARDYSREDSFPW